MKKYTTNDFKVGDYLYGFDISNNFKKGDYFIKGRIIEIDKSGFIITEDDYSLFHIFKDGRCYRVYDSIKFKNEYYFQNINDLIEYQKELLGEVKQDDNSIFDTEDINASLKECLIKINYLEKQNKELRELYESLKNTLNENKKQNYKSNKRRINLEDYERIKEEKRKKAEYEFWHYMEEKENIKHI